MKKNNAFDLYLELLYTHHFSESYVINDQIVKLPDYVKTDELINEKKK